MAKKQSEPSPIVRQIPDTDSIARYCGAATLDSAGRPTGAAFQARSQDAGRLSCDWVDCLAGPPASEQAEAVRASLRSRVAGYDANGKVGLLNVGRVRALTMETQQLDVIHVPTRRNTCHAAIAGVAGLLELTFAELLADVAAASTIPA